MLPIMRHLLAKVSTLWQSLHGVKQPIA